jgi:hypothetical protein
MRPIKLDKGTTSCPKAKEYQKIKIARIVLPDEEDEESRDSGSEESEESNSNESNSQSKDESSSESEESDRDKSNLQSVGSEQDCWNEPDVVEEEQGNWWDSPPLSD